MMFYTDGWFGWYMRETSVSVGFILILAGLLWGESGYRPASPSPLSA
jgi:hypothetical protein